MRRYLKEGRKENMYTNKMYLHILLLAGILLSEFLSEEMERERAGEKNPCLKILVKDSWGGGDYERREETVEENLKSTNMEERE